MPCTPTREAGGGAGVRVGRLMGCVFRAMLADAGRKVGTVVRREVRAQNQEPSHDGYETSVLLSAIRESFFDKLRMTRGWGGGSWGNGALGERGVKRRAAGVTIPRGTPQGPTPNASP